MKHKKLLENKIEELKEFCIENDIPLYLTYMDGVHLHTSTVTPEELEEIHKITFPASVKKKYQRILTIVLDFCKKDYEYKGNH